MPSNFNDAPIIKDDDFSTGQSRRRTPSQARAARQGTWDNIIKVVQGSIEVEKAELDKQLNENLSEKDREKLDGLKNLIKKN